MIQSLLALTASWSLGGVVALVAKVALVVGVASVMAAVLRRRSAAARHLTWSLAVVAAVLLAVASPIAPAVSVPMPEMLQRLRIIGVSDERVPNAVQLRTRP